MQQLLTLPLPPPSTLSLFFALGFTRRHASLDSSDSTLILSSHAPFPFALSFDCANIILCAQIWSHSNPGNSTPVNPCPTSSSIRLAVLSAGVTSIVISVPLTACVCVRVCASVCGRGKCVLRVIWTNNANASRWQLKRQLEQTIS